MFNTKKVELLAPAGNMECLKTAFNFGADAAYMAGKSFGLRAFAANFSDDELKEAFDLAKKLNKKIYITVNAVLRNTEFDGLAKYIEFLYSNGADALIISDPGVLQVIRELGDYEVHLSTQCNTSNYKSAEFWHKNGIKRIVLSRELSLKEISEIASKTPDSLELEVFVHGAMCIAYSGRCLLSSVLTGRSGNRGECAQPCRWRYTIHEAGYEKDYFPILEDDRGTYILNSKDLCMIDHMPELLSSGITSLKIEGRMKAAYYVANAVNAYRRAMDAYYDHPEKYILDDGLKHDLETSGTRRFTTGFYFPGDETEDHERIKIDATQMFAALVLENAKDGRVLVEQRNKFSVGEALKVLSPTSDAVDFVVNEITDEEGNPQDSAPHPQQHVYINCPYSLKPGDMLRVTRKKG